MTGKIVLLIVKIILGIMKIILLIIRGRSAGSTRHKCRVEKTNYTLVTDLYSKRYSVSDGCAGFFGEKIAYKGLLFITKKLLFLRFRNPN